MRFEAALNLAWLLLGVIALASTIRAATRRTAKEKSAPAWLHIVGVALIVAALFPYISATDDILRIEHLSAQENSHHPARKSSTDDLIRLYETMDTPLVVRVPVLIFTLFFLAFVVAPTIRLVGHFTPAEGGRSPPLPA